MAQMAHPKTLVAVYHHSDAAFAALRDLDGEGLPPQHVALVADDPELAGEIGGHSYAAAGSIGGFVLGVVVSALFVAIGGPSFREDIVGVVLGGAFVCFGLAFIGNVFGRGLVVHTAHAHAYEHAVQEGGALVTVECVGDECDHARHALATADEIVEETAS